MTGPGTLPDGLTCWVMSDGGAGMENQCLGLAEELGLAHQVKRIKIRQPWLSLPPDFWIRPLKALSPASDAIQPPWPDVLISSGRKTVGIAAAIRQASEGRTFAIQIQDPVGLRNHFDVIVTPRHDHLTGDNVISTYGSLTRVRHEKIAAEAEKFRDSVAHLPRPLVAVMVGGSNKVFDLNEEQARKLLEGLGRMCAEDRTGLLVTPSRRTAQSVRELVREGVSTLPALWWDGDGDNPYLGWLGLADAFVVTADSVNMVSETLNTGKPVMVFDLPGRKRKFAEFHGTLRDAGITRTFDGRLKQWTYPTFDDTADVARDVAGRINAWAAGR